MAGPEWEWWSCLICPEGKSSKKEELRIKNWEAKSDGEALADFRWNAGGLGGFGIDWDPQGARLSEEFAIVLAEDLDETLEGETRGLADPGAKNDFVTEARGRFVIDLVPQYDPADFIARGNGSGRVPMRGCDCLDPADVNGVVDVILPINVGRLNGNNHFERRHGFAHATL